jgi:hypothetical protein
MSRGSCGAEQPLKEALVLLLDIGIWFPAQPLLIVIPTVGPDAHFVSLQSNQQKNPFTFI